MASSTASASSVGLGALRVGDDDPVGPVETSATADDLHAFLLQPSGDVVGLVVGELLDAGVDPGEVDVDAGSRLRSTGRGVRSTVGGLGEVDAELGGTRDLGHQLGRRDQGLAGHAVGEHRRAAQTVGVDDGDVGAQLRGDEPRLVPTGPAPHDHDAGGGGSHGLIVAVARGPTGTSAGRVRTRTTAPRRPRTTARDARGRRRSNRPPRVASRWPRRRTRRTPTRSPPTAAGRPPAGADRR